MKRLCPHIAIFATMLLLSAATYGQQSVYPSTAGNHQAPQGVLTPWKSCRVACSETGLVDKIYVKPGTLVQVGDRLATLDIDQQSVLIEMAKIHAQATGRVASARAEVALNRRRLAAIEAGRKQEYSTQSELDRALAELEIALGKLANEEDQAAVEQLNLKKLQTQLDQRTVTAPIAGTVVRLYREVGEFVAPTSPEVLEIVDTARLRATFFLTAAEVERLGQQQTVLVQVDGAVQMEAELEFVAPVADGESGLIEVRFLIGNPARRVMGSSCQLLLESTGSELQS